LKAICSPFSPRWLSQLLSHLALAGVDLAQQSGRENKH
jgi:hypothetical protein